MNTVGVIEFSGDRFIVAYLGGGLYGNAAGGGIYEDAGSAVGKAIDVAVSGKAPLDCSVFLNYTNEVADRIDELDDRHRIRFRSYLKERPDLALRLEAKGISI